MAIAVIGGLIVSTLLSLLFVPAFFTMMDDFGHLLWRIFGRFVTSSEAEPRIRRADGAHAAASGAQRIPSVARGAGRSPS